jgi:hypothetical protein
MPRLVCLGARTFLPHGTLAYLTHTSRPCSRETPSPAAVTIAATDEHLAPLPSERA